MFILSLFRDELLKKKMENIPDSVDYKNAKSYVDIFLSGLLIICGTSLLSLSNYLIPTLILLYIQIATLLYFICNFYLNNKICGIFYTENGLNGRGAVFLWVSWILYSFLFDFKSINKKIEEELKYEEYDFLHAIVLLFILFFSYLPIVKSRIDNIRCIFILYLLSLYIINGDSSVVFNDIIIGLLKVIIFFIIYITIDILQKNYKGFESESLVLLKIIQSSWILLISKQFMIIGIFQFIVILSTRNIKNNTTNIFFPLKNPKEKKTQLPIYNKTKTVRKTQQKISINVSSEKIKKILQSTKT